MATNVPKEEIDEMRDLLIEAIEHLSYCNYGDSWERECAEQDNLPDRLHDWYNSKRGGKE